MKSRFKKITENNESCKMIIKCNLFDLGKEIFKIGRAHEYKKKLEIIPKLHEGGGRVLRYTKLRE